MSATNSVTVEHIIRRHPRERLFVQPSEWTGRHLELLQCVFEVQDAPRKGANGFSVHHRDVADDPRPYGYWAHEAEGLARSETKNAVIRRMLTDDRGGPFKCIRPFGFFHYGDDHRFRLHGLVFAPAQRKFPAKDQAPIFAFLQRNMIKIQRESVFTMPRSRRREVKQNIPVATMRQLQLRRLEPEDPTRDPYILAVLVGLAQAQADHAANANGFLSDDREYRVCAILVDEKNTEYMNFYSASITDAFLQKFDYPESLGDYSAASLEPSLAIQMKKFPYQPYSSLRQRLIDAIHLHHNKE